jgi:hypothetical protein
MKFYLSLLIVFFSCFARAQKNKDVELQIKYKQKDYDFTKYQKYDTVLVVGLFQQYRTFSTIIVQQMNADTLRLSEQTYLAESNLTGGIVLSYDKFRLAFATRNQPNKLSEGKGFTSMFNIGLSVGDNKYNVDAYFRRFKGFYNNNLSKYDSTERITKYFVLPNMVSSLFITRFMYFTNYRKYSYKSAFGCNYRQLKSAASWILGGTFNVFNIRNDSSLIPLASRYLYNDYAMMHGLRSINLGVNAGAAATIVLFKAWFVAGHFTLGPEQQWRNYNLFTSHRKISYVSWSGTGMFSLGLNLKRFYFLASFTNDYNLFDSKKIMNFRLDSKTNNVTLGWRFHYRTPRFYKRFQASKAYQML